MSKPNRRNLADKTSAEDNHIRPLSKYGFDDFMKLALNSFRVKKYGRAVDNCRLATEIAIRQSDNRNLAEAYDLWLNALLEEGKYNDAKKICYEARSKLGNYADLLFYEFKVSQKKGEIDTARKLAAEYLEILNKTIGTKNAWGAKTKKLADEARNILNGLAGNDGNNSIDIEMEK